ncbi:MAG: nuclear transport factor 2 family protein [Steroidobacteraceae bacterium]|nr:nuclear transport factor 2 family protein [Steroidobacteraceae bacterium]
MSEIAAPVTQVIEGYKAAVAARDIDAFMRLYDPSVRVFDAWGVWSYDGVPAWKSPIESWFASHPDDRHVVTFEDVSCVSTPTFASVAAIVTYAMVSARGEQVGAMQNRLTWILEPSGNGLSIVHEHTSVPVRFEDQKAILQRPGKP